MADSRYRLSISLGREVSFEILDEAFQDFSAVLRFARNVQALADRNEASLRVLRERAPEFEDFYWLSRRSPYGGPLLSGEFASPLSAAFQRAIEFDLAERGSHAAIAVERISYGSPFSININFNGDFIARILEIIRDWAAARRIARAEAGAREAEANARIATAEAYEEKARLEQDIYRRLREHLVLGERPALTQGQLEAMKTDRVIKSLMMLEQADLQIDPAKDAETDRRGE
jgi:hypothetical protein